MAANEICPSRHYFVSYKKGTEAHTGLATVSLFLIMLGS